MDYDNLDDARDRRQAVGTIVFALYLVAMGVILSEKDSLREWAWALLLFRAGQFLLGS